MDRFSKTCLVLIVMFLAVIALRPALTPQPVQAAPSYVYGVFQTVGKDLPTMLTGISSKGSDIFAVVPTSTPNNYLVIARSVREDPAGAAKKQ
jgi:hypothetical protein